MTTTRNLGQVQAIHVGTTPPTNTTMLWYDTSLLAPIHKFYDTILASWEPLVAAPLEDTYRLDTYSVNGVTDISFSSDLVSTDYYIDILEFISTSGVDVKSGWTISNKSVSGFRFTPPSSRFNTGALWYKATLIK